MSIQPHPTKGAGFWRIFISRGRKEKPDVVVFEGTLLEAQALEAEIRGIPRHGRAKLADILTPFFLWYENNRMASTVKACKLAFQTRIMPHYSDKFISLFTNSDHERYKAKRLADGVKKRTINIELLYFRSCLSWAKNEGYDIGQFPKTFEKRFTKADTPDVLTPEELTAIIGQLDGRSRLMVLLMGKCGLRKGEVSKLTAGSYRNGMLIVTGKGDKQRVVPLPEDVDKELLTIITDSKQADILFPVKDIRKRLDTAAKKAGIIKHVHPHMFRHTAGTIAVQAGVQQRVIQDWLGHEDIRTTEIYTRVVAENLKSAVEQMSNMFNTYAPVKVSNDAA